jgi:hypothetical protein
VRSKDLARAEKSERKAAGRPLEDRAEQVVRVPSRRRTVALDSERHEPFVFASAEAHARNSDRLLAVIRRLTWGLLFAAALFAPPGCVLGSEQDPGCRANHPEDCGSGYVCRAGACLRFSTEAGPAGGDARSDAPDAASDAGGG